MNYISVDVIRKEIEELKNALYLDSDNKTSYMFGERLLQKILNSQEYDGEIYCNVRHKRLKEDACNFIADYFEYYYDTPYDEIDFSKFDIDYLVEQFEEKEDEGYSFNQTWHEIVENYMSDFDEEDLK